jgi:serine/threonine protein kinase
MTWLGGLMDALHVDDPAELGPYRLRGRLGAGGIGVVYLGRDGDGRDAAVKVIYPHLIGDGGFSSRFAREIAIARAATGPSIAKVVDADPDAERPWIATEFVDGPSLERRVSVAGPLPQQDVQVLAEKLAEALATLHSAGVIHRDLKPSNVLLAEDGPRLVDFGIARALDGAEITNSGYAIGAPAFMSPEQATGGEAGPASDVFSLASVLTFAATGRSPFGKAAGPVAMLLRVSQQAPDLSDVAEPLRSHLTACLSRVPARRPTAEELVDRLRRATPSPPPLEPRPPVKRVETTIQPTERAPLTPAPAGADRKRWVLAGVATVAAIGIGTTVIVANQPTPSPAPPRPAAAPATPAPPPARKITLDGEQILSGHRQPVDYGVFSPDGRILATGSKDDESTEVRLWDTVTGQQIGSPFELEYAAAFSPDGAILATGGNRRGGGKVTLRNVETGQEIGQLDARLQDRGWVDAIAFSPDGRTVATRASMRGGEAEVSLWDLSSRALLNTWADEKSQYEPRRVQFTPDGRLLLLSGETGEPQFWDITTGQSVWTPDEPGPATLSTDGRSLAAWDQIRTLKLVVYDTRTHKSLLEIPRSPGFPALNPDGTVLAVSDGSTWDVTTGQRISRFDVEGLPGRPLAFSPDGKAIAYSSGSQIMLLRVTVSAT